MDTVCVCCFLGIHTWEDVRRQEISLRILLIFAVLGLIYVLGWKGQGAWELCFCLLPGLFLLLVGRITKEAVGYGDGSVVLTLGLYLTFERLLQVLMLASILSSLWAAVLLLVKHSSKTLPFLPFLLLGFLGSLVL